MNRKIRLSLGCFWLVSALLPSLHAQVVNATMTGIITDPSGAAVGGAKVTAINTGTNISHESQSDSAGVYTIPALTPGGYRLEVSQSGFKKEVLSGRFASGSRSAGQCNPAGWRSQRIGNGGFGRAAGE